MKRLLNTIKISRALDDGRRPAEFAQLLGDDESLREYAALQQQLIDRLKADAPAWVRRNESVTALPRQRRPVGSAVNQTVPLVTAIAACVLVSTMLLFGEHTNVRPQPPEPEPVALDLQNIRDAIDRSQRTATKLGDRMAELSGPVRSPSRIGDLTTHYVERAGAVFGRGLALLGGAGR